MFAEELIVTEAIYDVRESDNCPRTFETHFINNWWHAHIIIFDVREVEPNCQDVHYVGISPIDSARLVV